MKKNLIISKIVDFGIFFQISLWVVSCYHHYWKRKLSSIFKINLNIDDFTLVISAMIIGLVYIFFINRNKNKKEDIYLRTCIFFMCLFFSLSLIEYLVHWSLKERDEIRCILFCRLPYIFLSLNIIAGYFILKIKGKSIEKIKSSKNIALTLIYEFFVLSYSLLSLIDYWFIKRLGIVLSYRSCFLYKRVRLNSEELMDYKIAVVLVVIFISSLLVCYSYRCMKKSVKKGYLSIGGIFMGIYYILTNYAFYIRSYDPGSFVSWYPGFYFGEVFPIYLLAQNISMYFCIQLYKFKLGLENK